MNAQPVDVLTPGFPGVMECQPIAVGDQVSQGDADFAFEPVPPTKTSTVAVQIHFRGRGQPLQYNLDEEYCK